MSDASHDHLVVDNGSLASQGVSIATRLFTEVLTGMKAMFVGKDEIIDLMGVSLVGGENLFLHGPPGTAKSALVQELGRRIEGRVFDYLLTRFTEPNELFGPFDIRRLREGDLVTNTEGMLPEASFIFLDELLNANSAILNSLLGVLNERVFRRGRETLVVPSLMVVGASNHLPDDDALGALFDRFPLRVSCDNVAHEQLAEVLVAGWDIVAGRVNQAATLTIQDVQHAQQAVFSVDLTELRTTYVELIHRLRHAGLKVSDRRAVRLQKLAAASALLAGRTFASVTDLWVLRYIWDTEDQQEVLAEIVQSFVDRGAEESAAKIHPRSRGHDRPDPDKLARDLDRLSDHLQDPLLPEVQLGYLRDQLAMLAARCQWVDGEQQRTFLEEKIAQLGKLPALQVASP
jgi:MoxR-like ATPase